MNVNIKRNFIYNPERVKEVKRLYQEFVSRAILRIIEKDNHQHNDLNLEDKCENED